MADSSVIIDVKMDTSKADKDLAKLKKEIESTESAISEGEAKKYPLTEQAERLRQEMRQARAEVERYKQAWISGVAGADGQQARAQERLVKIQNEYEGVVQQIDKIDTKLLPAYGKLERMKEEAGGLQENINKAAKNTRKMEKATKKADKHMGIFATRLRGIVLSAFVFNILSRGFRELTDWMGNVIKSNDEARASIAKLKGALLTLAQPLVEVVIPAFIAFVEILAAAIEIMARFVAAFFGTTAEDASKSAEELYNEQQALEGVGDAAQKATKQLASFDEINRLSDNSSQSNANIITPDFSGAGLANLPEWMKNLVFDIEAKIRELRFSWEKGELMQNQDSWIIALTGLLGAVIGGMFGGLYGSIIGLLLGLSIGLWLDSFIDKMENADKVKNAFMVILAAILGAVLGGMFGGLSGATIGLLLGLLVGLVGLEFKKGEASKWDEKDTLTVVLSAILGAILGAAFGGFTGAIIGLLLGATISFTAIQFTEGKYNKDKAIATLRIALFAILGAVLGSMFGGFIGGVVGLLIGLTIGFASVGFDKNLESSIQTKAQEALRVALFTIIGALIGAVFGGGVFGGIVGGVIGLTFGLYFNFYVEGFSGIKKSVPNFKGIGPDYSWMFKSKVPGFATGSVIPPNREFLAVLGDNKTETEVVSPLSTMKQAMMEALRESGAGGKGTTIVLNGEMAALARVLRPYIEEEGRRVGVTLVTK